MKEFTELRTTLNETAEDLVEHMLMPPQVLVLRRITVRQFPGDTMVALYKNDRLGLTFSIPYGSDVKPVITPVHEETEQLDELSRETLGSYAKKATGQAIMHAASLGNAKTKAGVQRAEKPLEKRSKGIFRAISKLAKEETEQLDEISIPTATRAYHGRQQRGLDAMKKGDYSTALPHFKKALDTMRLRSKKYEREDKGETIKEGYPSKKHQDAKRASWMGTFEDHVNDQEPRHAGKIEWDTAHHFYNQGHAPVDAARKYVNSKSDSLPSKHDPEGIEKNAWGKLHEESEHGVIQRLRNIKDFHSIKHITHADGTKTHVDPTTAHALLTVHDALKPEHQAKFVQHLEHSKHKFHKMLDFTWKQVK